MTRTSTSAKRKADGEAPAPAPAAGGAAIVPDRPAEEIWPIESIKAHVRNARKHPKGQIEQLRSSLKQYGQVHPLLVREDGTLISGHGRLEAMRHEGFVNVAVIVARGWTEEQCRAFAILDNKTALNSEWDDDLLSAELKDLELAGVDLSMLGFNDKELDKLLPEEANTNAGEGGAGAQTLKAVIQFNIVFDDENQQAAWFGFVKRLKLQYPKEETLGARLGRFMETLPAALPGKPEGSDAKG